MDTIQLENKEKYRKSYGSNPDVTFFFPDNGGAQLFVEKRKLSYASVVFRKQFSAGYNSTDRIPIKDIPYDTFNILMRNIYGEPIEIREANYQEILYAATKYFIYPLIEKVVQFVTIFVTAENITEHYEFIERYEIKRLNEHMEKICIKYPIKIIEKLSDSKSHMDILKIILQSPNLNCSEYELYVAVVNMMEKASMNSVDVIDVAADMRMKIGKLLYLIRFPVMSVDELIKCAKAPSLMTKEQLMDILLWSKEGIYSETVQFFSTNERSTVNFDKCPHCFETYAYCLSCSKYR